MSVCTTTPTMQSFIRTVKVMLPIVGRDREKIILPIIEALNKMLPENGIVDNQQYEWRRAKACPMDALSLAYKPKDATEWTEDILIALYWEFHPGAMPILRDADSVKVKSDGLDRLERWSKLKKTKKGRKISNGWHTVSGYTVYIENGKIWHGVKRDRNGNEVAAYPYRVHWEYNQTEQKKQAHGWDNCSGISVDAFRSLCNRGYGAMK